jgi:hypothetical protein
MMQAVVPREVLSGHAAGEDSHIGGQPYLSGDFANDAHDIAADILDPVGGQVFVNELADVYVFTYPAQTQEGRILGAEVFLVEIVQRFQVLSKIVVRFEADEYRLVDQKFQHTFLHNQQSVRFSASLKLRLTVHAQPSWSLFGLALASVFA